MHSPRHGTEALETAARILDKLTDPESVAVGTGYPDSPDSEDSRLLWSDLSLACGFPGVSLAFSGTTDRRPEQVTHAHTYLQRTMAVVAQGGIPPAGLYGNISSAAYSLLIAHHATGGYRSALHRLDAYHQALTCEALPRLSDTPIASNSEFDVISGISGLGRHLLARSDACLPELRSVLAHLVAMADGDVAHHGHRVPRWWTWAAPKQGQEAELPDGHLNLGLSHGICGPLALLSLAWQAGVIVDGQREAIESILGILETWAIPEGDGIRWPSLLTLEQWTAGPANLELPWPRPSWCYGAPGMTRAVQLAALALDRSDWHDLAHRSLLPLLTHPITTWGLEDAGLCHGTSGLLHLFGLLGRHLDDNRIGTVRDELAALTLARFHPDHRFGFRAAVNNAPQGADLPGYLDGAAGIALALDAYAHGGHAHARWDMALLVA